MHGEGVLIDGDSPRSELLRPCLPSRRRKGEGEAKSKGTFHFFIFSFPARGLGVGLFDRVRFVKITKYTTLQSFRCHGHGLQQAICLVCFWQHHSCLSPRSQSAGRGMKMKQKSKQFQGTNTQSNAKIEIPKLLTLRDYYFFFLPTVLFLFAFLLKNTFLHILPYPSASPLQVIQQVRAVPREKRRRRYQGT